jgi:xanthine dehydrogenase accessory factor
VVWQTLQKALAENRNCVLVTSLEEGDSNSSLVLLPGKEVVGPSIPEEVIAMALEAYSNRKHSIITIGHQEYFIQVFPRRSQLLIIGAAHITVDLVQLAALHDFETIVIDPRAVFARQTQFKVPPDHLLEKYPSDVLHDFILDGYTYAVVLSHDPKIDDNALGILLRSKVGYIGALGSRKTHDKRRERLSKAGFSEEEIDRIESPVGMDIHAQGAKEIALSIMGSVIRVKNSFL